MVTTVPQWTFLGFDELDFEGGEGELPELLMKLDIMVGMSSRNENIISVSEEMGKLGET